jgi:RIO-like serine/threonine protein kinase
MQIASIRGRVPLGDEVLVETLQYIQNSKNLVAVDPQSITPSIVKSLFETVGSFATLGVIHGDLNFGNILISSFPPRAVIIDFGGSAL